MSDFGSIIYITKADKAPFQANEVQQIEEIAAKLKQIVTSCDSLGKPFRFDVGKTISLNNPDECFTVNLLLSDHWGDDQDYKWHQDTEERALAKVTTLLREEFKLTYQLEPTFGWW